GAGGGPIARAQLGVVAVGPESASSMPGPVCYARGGVEPTVTDANLVLGYLNPDYFAGGSLRLDADAARHAMATRVAQPLGLSVEDAAWGVHAIVNTNMELATRIVSIERGRDPRDLTFIAFGGSGPVHGCRLAQALGVPRVILPAAAGVTAAIGLLAAEVRFDVARTLVRRLDALDPHALTVMFDEMAAQATAVVRDGGLKGRRRAWFPETRGWTECAVYDRYALAPGSRLNGPAIVEERESTSVLPPGTSATVDEYANLIVEIAP